MESVVRKFNLPEDLYKKMLKEVEDTGKSISYIGARILMEHYEK